MSRITEEVAVLPQTMLALVYSYAKGPQTELFPKREGPPFIDYRVVDAIELIQTVEDFVSMYEENHLTSDDYDRPSSKGVSLFSMALFLGRASLVQYMCAQRLKRNFKWEGSPQEYPKRDPSPNLLYSCQVASCLYQHSPLTLILQFGGSEMYSGARRYGALTTIDYLIQEASDLIDMRAAQSPTGICVGAGRERLRYKSSTNVAIY